MKRYFISSCVLLLLYWTLFSAISISSIPLDNVENLNGNRILKSSSNIGLTKILSDTQVNNYTEGYQYFPAICGLTDEIIAITWHGPGESDDYGVYARIFNATSGKNVTSEFRVNNYTEGYQYFPAICSLTDEIFAITWFGESESEDFDVYARIFNATSGKNITSEFRVNNYTTNNQHYPSICALSNEIVVVAWYGEGESDAVGVYARVFNATSGKNITSEFRVNNYTINNQRRPSICALSNETFVVAWYGVGESDDYGVYARMFNATTGENLSSEYRVNDYMDDGQEFPSICALSNESFAVVWQSNMQDASNFGIYARTFNSITGENLTSEFCVNDYTLGKQSSPSICAVSKDIIAITWESYGQDGDGYGVYAKIINITSGVKMSSELRINNQIIGDQIYPSICSLSTEMIALTWCGRGQNIDYDIHLSIFAIETINSKPDSPANDFIMYLLIFIIFLGIILSIIGGSLFLVKKKKYTSSNNSNKMVSKYKERTSSYLIEKPVNTSDTVPHKKLKKSALPTSKIGLTESEKEDLKQTESEVNVEKPKIICVVHKGPIEGNIYMCPKCNTFYCVNCARILKQRGEKCWVCDSSINLE